MRIVFALIGKGKAFPGVGDYANGDRIAKKNEYGWINNKTKNLHRWEQLAEERGKRLALKNDSLPHPHITGNSDYVQISNQFPKYPPTARDHYCAGWEKQAAKNKHDLWQKEAKRTRHVDEEYYKDHPERKPYWFDHETYF